MGLSDRPERDSKAKARSRIQMSDAYPEEYTDLALDQSNRKRSTRLSAAATSYASHENGYHPGDEHHDDDDENENEPLGTGHFNVNSSQSPPPHANITNLFSQFQSKPILNPADHPVPDLSNHGTSSPDIPHDISPKPDSPNNENVTPIVTGHHRRLKKPIILPEDDDDENILTDDSANDSDEADDAEFRIPQNTKIPVCLPLKSGKRGILLKSGRVSIPPKTGVTRSPPRLRHRTSPVENLSRGERYKRRNGDPENTIGRENEPARELRSSKRRKVSREHDDSSRDSDQDGPLSDSASLSPDPPRNGSSSRLVKKRDPDSRKSRRTRSATRRNRNTEEDPAAFKTNARLTRSSVGTKSTRSFRNGKDSDDDEGGKGDEDFQEPSNSDDEESDEQMEDCVDEHEIAATGDSDDPPRRRSQRHKSRPQRTVSARKSTRIRTNRKPQADGDAFGKEMNKSYRPRAESLRPSDFYREGEISNDSSISSQGVGARGKRERRPTRQAATRASDAIANEMNNVDFLENPMAAVDGGKPSRPSKRADRYNRHRSRFRPARPDTFASDDESHAPGVNPSPIEPMEVDVNLSWDDIGGMDHHVRALKEMVFLPLMYPEVFEKFGMEAPKGVLFYGPPGTGKTLCARALAASCGAEVDPNDTPKESGGGPQEGKAGDKAGSPNQQTLTPKLEPKNVVDSPDGQGTPTPMLTADLAGAPNGPSTEPTLSQAAPWTGIVEKKPISIPLIPVVKFEPASDAQGTIGGTPANAVKVTNEAVNGTKEVANGTSEAGNGTNNAPAIKPPKKKPRVAFFMRNGADCLSKWVGEAERQLRMTFEAAKRHQPSIIFFDEIDGLAPVRSSRQDQIHSSIVSTLLGLMDGLDARGKIVVIGATNRVDAIDPALRRPGRFDRELIFTLPNATARRKILGIHTSKWSPPPKPHVVDAVAQMTVGYCGADLKALCSESAIRALRRRYPQIYQSSEKLLINVDEVRVSTKDFLAAMSDVVPASHRSARTCARPLPQRIVPVLREPLENCIAILQKIFPQGISKEAVTGQNKNVQKGSTNGVGRDSDDDSISSSDDDGENGINVEVMQSKIQNAGRLRPTSSKFSMLRHKTLRPRFLLCGDPGLGQTQLGPALLHHCEGCPVHAIDFPSLHADVGARSPEEALTTAFREAARSVPSILYLPHLQLWWASASQSLQTTLIIALKDLPSDLPLLVLATAEEDASTLPAELVELFGESHQLSAPREDERAEMFAPVVTEATARPNFADEAAKKRRRQRVNEVLPKAPPPPPTPVTVADEAKKLQTENRYIRMLRMEMRNFVESLLRDKQFKAFWVPVDPALAPDYYEIIEVPMDIQNIAANVDSGAYPTVLAMVNDFNTMVKNAIQYNPPNTEVGAAILRRAHGLIDIVHAWVDNLNPPLVEACNKIIADRIARAQAVEEVKKNHHGDGSGDASDARSVDAKASKDDSVPKDTDDVMMGPVAPSACVEGEKTDVVENRRRREDVMDVDVIAPANNEEQEIRESAVEMEKGMFMEAKVGQVRELGKLLVDVSSGMTVDALEGLLVRCEKVLHDFRHESNRIAAVRELSTIVRLAREDPVLVGKLVA